MRPPIPARLILTLSTLLVGSLFMAPDAQAILSWAEIEFSTEVEFDDG